MSSRHVTTCDQCATETESADDGQWLDLVVGYGRAERQLDFCGWGCFASFVSAEAGRQAGLTA